MRQRIVLISALLHDPDVLILDEPFSGLDTTSALIVRKVIELLESEGKAIFFSSPVLEVVEKLCTHLVILREGAVVVSGSMEEVRANFAQKGFEQAFLQLSEHVDAGQIARNLVGAIRVSTVSGRGLLTPSHARLGDGWFDTSSRRCSAGARSPPRLHLADEV